MGLTGIEKVTGNLLAMILWNLGPEDIVLSKDVSSQFLVFGVKRKTEQLG